MISEHNFTVHKGDKSYNMHDLGVWVNYFQLSSPNVSHEKVRVPSLRKTLITSHEEEERKLRIELLIESDDMKEYNALVHLIYDIFFTSQEVFLERDAHLGERITAILEGDYAPDDITSTDGEIEFEMTMTDPVIAGPEITRHFEDGILEINNYGTVETPPVLEIEVLDDITHIDIISNDGTLRIGEAPEADTTVFEPLTKVLDLPLTSLNNWFVANLDNGYVGGNMQASAPKGMRPQTFGAAIIPHKYQGPAVRRSLPDPLQDLRIDIDVDLLNKAALTGMFELYALDASSNVVFVIGVEDVLVGSEQIRGKFQVGGASNRLHQFFAEPSNVRAWNNFKGTLRVHRRGNKITPYWALIDADGNHVWKYSSHSYTDTLDRNMAPITQIAIAMRGWPTTTFADMAARNLKVYRYNSAPEGVPVIASLGDKFIVDMENSHVLLNGEDYPEIAFGSNFFDIPSGKSLTMLHPSDKLNALMRYKERSR